MLKRLGNPVAKEISALRSSLAAMEPSLRRLEPLVIEKKGVRVAIVRAKRLAGG